MKPLGWCTCGLALAAAMSVAVPAAANAAAFTNGDLVVERVTPGGTDTALSGDGATINLDEISTSGGTPIQTLTVPNLSDSGSASSDGGMSRSSDGQYLVLPAYDAAPGTASVTSATGIDRAIVEVDAAGTISVPNELTDAYTANNFRSVASPDGTNFYLGGTGTPTTSGGVRYTTAGSSTTTQISGSPATNVRNVAIFDGQLFTSSNSTSVTVATVGTGLPTSTGQTETNVLAAAQLPTSDSTYGYWFADLIPGVGFDGTDLDTLYVVDTTQSKILKFSYGMGSWIAAGSVTIPAGGFGLTGSVTDGTVNLYATYSSVVTGATPSVSSGVISISDPDAATSTLSGTPTTIESSTSETTGSYRGIAFAPVASTAAGWSGARVTPAAVPRRGVEIRWSDGAGDSVVGFTVARQVKGSTKRTLITRHLIVGGALSSHDTYSFYDPQGTAGDRYYVIAHLKNGKTRTYGPFSLSSAKTKGAQR